MKKLLILATFIFSGAAFAAGAGDIEKIDSTFDSLDNNDDAFVSQEEADDDNVWGHFTAIDTDGDKRLSQTEFNTYIRNNPGMVEDMEEVEDAE